MATRRPITLGVARPPCPKHHTGRVWLDGHAVSRDGRYERTRFRCFPDNGDEEHVYLAPMPRRRRCGHGDAECPECEHLFARADGLTAPWHFSLAVREIAAALYEAGLGTSYRDIGERAREQIARRAARGTLVGQTSHSAALAMDYLDAFADVVAQGPDRWPRILAVDSRPILVPNHSACCGVKLKQRQAKQAALGEIPEPAPMWGPLVHEWAELDKQGRRRNPPKTKHSSRKKAIGHLMVAVGYDRPRQPHLWLVRMMGGDDQESWAEFLRSLPGTPEWIVSDRSGAIEAAVADVWGGGPTHYFCEQHLAVNGLKAAKARLAPGIAQARRERKARDEAERAARGLPALPKRVPKRIRSVGSVAGKTLADFSELATQWHATRNGSLTPAYVPAGSGQTVWWSCDVGPDHEWQAQVRSRTIRDAQCPFCTHRRVAPSQSLVVTHPDLVPEWHPTRNGALTPRHVSYGMPRDVWWRCAVDHDHEWLARIASRTGPNHTGCPICSGARGKPGRPRRTAPRVAEAVAA